MRCENSRKLILIRCENNCKIGATDCDKVDKIFIKLSHTLGGWSKNPHTGVKIQDILRECCITVGTVQCLKKLYPHHEKPRFLNQFLVFPTYFQCNR